MQSLGRPVARAAWGLSTSGSAPCSLRLGSAYLGLRRGRGSWQSPSPPPIRSTAIRFYSSPPTSPKDTKNTTPESENTTSNPENSAIPLAPPSSAPSQTSPDSPAPNSALHTAQHNLKEKLSLAMDTLQTRLLTASKTLNDLTGYTSIERIKRENETLETDLANAHAALRAARQHYKSSNAKRAATQREVTTLLARKETWSPADLERFTELYRTDHVLEGEVAAAQGSLTEAEAEEQSLSQRLNAGILKRYHEEQIWSDRIRRASTWGTWGLMGMNFLLFVVLQFVAEPWKRRRLVRGVVEEEKAVLEEVRGELAAVKEALGRRDEPQEQAPVVVEEPSISDLPILTDVVVEEPVTWQAFLCEPHRWKAAAEDLCSDRRVEYKMRDASMLALQAAAAGVACTLSVFWIIGR